MPSLPNPTSPFWREWSLSYVSDPYGPIYGGHAVQVAAVNTLRMWLPAYIKDFNRQFGGEILTLDTESFRPFDDRSWSADQDVQIDVIVSGTTGKPVFTNENGIMSTWKMDVNVNVYAGSDWQETLALCYAYGAATRACIVQHRDLSGFAQTTMWTGETYFKGQMPVGDRYVGMSTVNFEVTISNTVNPFAGPPAPDYAAEDTPTEPSLLPLPPFPDVLSTNVEVEQLAQSNPNGSQSP